jgi:hypothetical protein
VPTTYANRNPLDSQKRVVGRLQAPFSMRPEINFPSNSNVICPVNLSLQKYSACPVGATQWRISARLTR